MTPHKGAAALLLLFVALALSACGTQNAKPTAERSENIPVADLAVMVLPKGELGEMATGLRVSADSSGPTKNVDAADDTLDPTDTAKSLKSAGRIAGYDLDYEAPEERRGTGAGLVAIGTTAELFTDPVYATQYVSKQVSDVDRFVGRVVRGIRLVRVRSFGAVGVGEEAAGMQILAATGKRRAHVTVIYFRRGRLVGQAWEIRRDGRTVDDEITRIALTLDTRIQRVLAGQVDEKPVALPGKPKEIDPKPLTLRARDFEGATIAHEGSRQAHGVRAYLREFDVVGGGVGGSKMYYLRALTQVFPSRRSATIDQRFLATAEGSRKVTAAFLDAWLGGDRDAITNVSATPVAVRGADTSVFRFSFTAPKGRMEGVMLSVQRGRVLGSVTVIGRAAGLDPMDILTARAKLRERLTEAG
jgi:hypothetical protein